MITIVPSPEELSDLKIEVFEELLKTKSENAEMHYIVFCMMLEVSVANGLLDRQKFLQKYLLDNKLELEDDDLADLFVRAVECKQISSIECLLELISDEDRHEIMEDISLMLYNEIEETGSKEVRKLFKRLVPKKEDREKITHAHLDSKVLKDENSKILKALKVVSMLDPSYQKWLSYSSYKGVKKVIDHYVDVADFVSLVPMCFAMGNLFSEKGLEFSSKSVWKPIFTSENEVILTIAEFLSSGSGKYLKIAMPSIREALGINEKFIDLYDDKLEDLEVSGDDSDLESLD